MNLPKNEHNVIFPIPYEYWPDWSNYATINKLGEIHFFSNKPKYNTSRQAYLTIGGRKAYWGKVLTPKQSLIDLLWFNILNKNN